MAKVYDKDHADEDMLGGSPGWYKPSRDDDDEDTAQTEETKSSSPDELKSAEESAEDGGSEAEETEADALERLGAGYHTDGPTRAERVRGFVLNRRNMMLGGTLVGLLGIFFVTFMGFSAFEAIHVRENMLGRFGSNRLVYKMLERRRGKSFARQMRRLSSDANATGINKMKLTAKLEERGFMIDFDEEGKVKLLEYQADDGRTKRFNFDEPDLKKATNDFFQDPDIGLEISQKFDEVMGVKAATLKGGAARRFMSAKLGISSFKDWLGRPPPDADSKTNGEIMDQKLREAAAADREAQISRGQRRGGDTNGDGEEDATERALRETEEELDDQLRNVDEATERIRNGSSVDEALDGMERAAEGLTDDALRELLDEGLSPETITNVLDDLDPALAARISTRSAAGAIKFLNVAEYGSTICRARGTINFVTNIKAIYAYTQLAVFAARFLTAADNQKAGLVYGDGMNVLMKFLHSTNPATGKSYSQAGGFQSVIMGNSDARPSPVNLARFSTGRSDSGILGSFNRFFNSIPGTSPGMCGFYNNGLVQLGGAIVGLGLAFFSGGTVSIGQVATGFGLGIVKELVFMIGTPILVRAATNSVISGFDNGEMAGDALGSGWGALRGMGGNANAGRPITEEEAVALDREVQVDKAYAMSRQSIFDRFFNVNNHESLASQVAFSIPQSSSLAYAATSGRLFNPSFWFGGLLSAFTPSASAQATTEKCQDPQVLALGLKTDVFCNLEFADFPDLDTDQTEAILLSHQVTMSVRDPDTDKCEPVVVAAPLITPQGEPISYPNGDTSACRDAPEVHMDDDLQDYISYCLSGRASILYSPDVSTDGTGSTVASMKVHQPDGTVAQPCVSAGPALSNETQGVGRFDRYADWYGYMIDVENFTEDINEEYKNSPTTTNPTSDNGGTFSYEEYASLTRQQLNERLLANPNWQPQLGRVNSDIQSGVAKDDLVRLMLAIVEKAKVVIKPSVIQTGHATCTAGGTTSNHFGGLAIDIGNEEVAPQLVPWLYQNRAQLSIDEMIINPVPAGTSNLDRGIPHSYNAGTLAGHTDHIHVSVMGTKTSGGCPND